MGRWWRGEDGGGGAAGGFARSDVVDSAGRSRLAEKQIYVFIMNGRVGRWLYSR